MYIHGEGDATTPDLMFEVMSEILSNIIRISTFST